jgi:lipoprotein-anchoring transpeptidase ErfK/SrfK
LWSVLMSKAVLVSSLSAVAALLIQSSGALAFHPFDQPQGYQMPDWSKRKAAGRAAVDRPTASIQQRQPQWFDADEDEAPAPPQRTVKAAPVKNPPVLDGGGRPSISPAAPPVVSFDSGSGAGTIIIDTRARALYYTLSATTAYRYPISVGRDGFTWTGTEKITRVASWPDWRPPAEMKERVPTLPDLMTGGVRNPLGAKALYLGNSLYRIHGTNDVATIGQAASSGCFRMTNANVLHLASLAGVGTTVRVLSKVPNAYAGNSQPRKRG